MIWLFSCFFHKGFPICKDQCVQMAKEKTKPWLYPNPMRKGAGRAPMVGQVKPWRDWPKKYFTKIRVFFFGGILFSFCRNDGSTRFVWGVCPHFWPTNGAGPTSWPFQHSSSSRAKAQPVDCFSGHGFPRSQNWRDFHQVKVGKLWCWPWKAANDWPLNWSEKIHHFQQPTS